MMRIFRHYIPSSFLMLGLLEFFALAAAMGLGVELRFLGADSGAIAEVMPIAPKALTFALVMLAAMATTGLYKNNIRDGRLGMVLRFSIAFLLGLVGMIVLFYSFPPLFLGRGAFALGFGIGVASIIIIRTIFYRIVGQEQLKRRVIVLGAGKRAVQFNQLRRKIDQMGFTILGFVHVASEQDQMPQEKVIHLEAPLLEFAQKHNVSEIVVAVEDRRKDFAVDDLLDCKMSGIDVVDIQTFFERQTGKIRLDILHPSWLIFSDGFQQGPLQLLFKRCFDIAASSFLLFLAWPFMLLAALAIWIESGFSGPILYRQVRVGQNWRLFQVLKFRSMRIDAEINGAQWAKKNDDRITRVGKFLRRSRIDELPQLLNVFKGDMSFVGPRPERPEFVEQLSEQIPYYAERHRVKPGITGWAQIRYPYGSSENDAMEKLQYDLYYVKNYSIFLDLLILFQTAEVVLWGQGAR
ncbi:MAG: TIGR03013 family PEP-CTERM/XrtA system glycosyltransferase [Gammaproteobacteria bacterium]|nr:TIGR03013 family PEP-CTERM/XrtA system glycosyltransferase [Gammaproteobacteria bacterium]